MGNFKSMMCFDALMDFLSTSNFTVDYLGGEKAYLGAGFGKIAGFLYAWVAIVVLKPSAISAITYTCGQYLVEAFHPGCGKSAENVLMIKLVASFSIGT